ncbi:MAG: hypothetical protein R3D60_13050 [Paracoccaceae bacterium]
MMALFPYLRRRLALAICPEISTKPAAPFGRKHSTRRARKNADDLRRLDRAYRDFTGMTLSAESAPEGPSGHPTLHKDEVRALVMAALDAVRGDPRAGIDSGTLILASQYFNHNWPAPLIWPLGVERIPGRKVWCIDPNGEGNPNAMHRVATFRVITKRRAA